MPGRLTIGSFTISLDGYGAGPNQSLESPLGVGGEGLHWWLLHTRTFKQTHGGEGGETSIGDDFAARGMANVGAWILGRNMFGPIRGPWCDDAWRGWGARGWHTHLISHSSSPRCRSVRRFSIATRPLIARARSGR